MPLTVIGWLFTIGVLAHNAEEALYLPAWSQRPGRFRNPVGASVFRCAAVFLSVLFVLVTAAASAFPPAGLAAYLMAGYVLAMVLNVFVPHVLATVVTRKYMPGTATALIFNLPLGVFYLTRALAEQQVSLPTFYWAGPVVVLALLALLPGLFAVGRRFHPAAQRYDAT